MTQTVNPGGAGATTSLAYAISPQQDGVWSRTMQILDPDGVKATTTMDANGLGQTVWSEDPVGVTTRVAYDGLGNQVSVVISDPASGRTQTRAFAYDALSRLTSRTEPETGTTTFSKFDALGHATTIKEENGGRVRTLVYDGLGRRVSLTNGADACRWTYTGLALASTTSKTTNQEVSQSFAYAGPAGALSQETTTQPGLTSTLQYAYDPTGAVLQSITYPAPSNRVISYEYDSCNRVKSVKADGVPVVASITYGPWGLRSRITFASQAWDAWERKDGGTHLDTWTMGTTAGGALADFTVNPRHYAYNSAEQLTTAAEWTRLTPDPKGRLLGGEARDLGLSSVAFSHDGFDNNTASAFQGAGSGSLTAFSINPSTDNLTPTLDLNHAVTGWTYPKQNGEAGTVGVALGARSPSLGLTWDGLGRLAKVSDGQTGNEEAYLYAASGLRVAASDSLDRTSRQYTYASDGHLMTEAMAPSGTRDIVYAGGIPVAELDDHGIHELHLDHLGTPRVITDGATGKIEGVLNFGPYGEFLAGSSGGYLPALGYTGHVMAPRLRSEPYGLLYMRGRYYSPVWHRFVNSDLGVDAGQLNQMAYAGGDPIFRTDPTGLAARPQWDDPKQRLCPTLRLDPEDGNTNSFDFYRHPSLGVMLGNGGALGVFGTRFSVDPMTFAVQKKKVELSWQFNEHIMVLSKSIEQTIKELAEANDAGKRAADCMAIDNYLKSIGMAVIVGAAGGAVTGGETIGTLGTLFGGPVGAAPALGAGALGGAVIGGFAGLVPTVVNGGVALRVVFRENENSWRANYRAIQNYSNINGIGMRPEIRY